MNHEQSWKRLGVTRAVVDRSNIEVEGSSLDMRIDALRKRGCSEREIEELMPKLIEAERQSAALMKVPYTDKPWSNPYDSNNPPDAINIVEYVDVNTEDEADALEAELDNPFA